MENVKWWSTSFGEAEISAVATSIRNQRVSQGTVTREFELALADYLSVKHVVAVSSGSTALLATLIALGIGPGDEVIVPCRTWIATAHAVALLGARVVLVDVLPHIPIMDVSKVESQISSRTRAVIPVHMNGRGVDLQELRRIAKKHGIYIIEDAAQAFGSRCTEGYFGTLGDAGCFSLSVAKTISTGQGGFVATNSDTLESALRAVRTHGVENTVEPRAWVTLGLNFRYTDIAASIGLEQLKQLPAKLNHLRSLYSLYEEQLQIQGVKMIPVNTKQGEIPQYIEAITTDRDNLVKVLASAGIETRVFYPSINRAKYLGEFETEFPNANLFEAQGIYLPSGPTQAFGNVGKVRKALLDI